MPIVESGRRIHLLVSDVGLPNGMNGRQLADAARAIDPSLRVLFITGYANADTVGNATGAGSRSRDQQSGQRIYGSYGPAPARDVLRQLLDGSGYNVIMVGDRGHRLRRHRGGTARRQCRLGRCLAHRGAGE